MSNGDAQTAVRQDILKSDARAVASTVRAQLAAPWTRFRFGENAPVPRLHFKVEQPEDLAQLAAMVNTLSQAGFKADAAELSARFGLKLRYEAPAPAPGFALAAEKSDRSDKSDLSDLFAQKVYGKCAREIATCAEETDPEEFRKKLEALAADPEIDQEAFAAAVQRELMAGYLDGLKHSRIKRNYDE
jgi:hypothetical protein